MDKTLDEFKRDVKWKHYPKTKKIRNSWGVYDYFKYYRKHRPDTHEYVLYESVYFAIIRKVNKLLVEDFYKTGSIKFPFRMGGVTAYKKPVKTFIRDGKVITTRTVDWDKTLELWYNDHEAYDRRDLIYRQNNDRIKIRYDKGNAIYKNKYFYDFTLCREASNKIKRVFENGSIAFSEIISKDDYEQIKGLYDEY